MAERRPIATRDTRLAQAVARRLAASSVTPNAISMASIAFGALAGGAFWVSGWAEAPRALVLILAALACQGRLLCNLFDGMVAVEGGKAGPDGPFWNEAPDRAADILILAGMGAGAGAPGLGWAAAAMAVLTAYVRELGSANGQPADFSGPMAKPQRMALATGAALVAVLWPPALLWALWIIAAGAAVTALRRALRILRAMKSGG